MSRNEGGASDAASAGPVYDFLYHDARRTQSFLGQLDPSGHPIGVKQSETTSRTEGTDFTSQGTLNAGVGKGSWTRKNADGSTGGEGVERAYDPLWANARAFLDHLTAHNMLVSDARQARIGQFVGVTGHLLFLDMTIMKSAWDKPEIKRVLMAEQQAGANRSQRRAAVAQGQVSGAEMASALLPLLPHSLQGMLIGGGVTVWAALLEDAMVGRASDLVLKHGVLVDGDWTMIGILDAYPYDPGQTTDGGQPVTEFLAGLAESLVGQVVARLAPIARQTLGRPPSAHGMTPLMIFREVSGQRASA